MVEVVSLFRQSPRGVTSFPIRVHGPVVVCTGPIFAVVTRATEEQSSFITIICAIAATAARCYGVPAARITTPLLPAAAGQENGNERNNQ